jgi:hypothetical protein
VHASYADAGCIAYLSNKMPIIEKKIPLGKRKLGQRKRREGGEVFQAVGGRKAPTTHSR